MKRTYEAECPIFLPPPSTGLKCEALQLRGQPLREHEYRAVALMRHLFLIVLTLFVTGCEMPRGEPRIDGSTHDSYHASLGVLLEGLSTTEKEDVVESIMFIRAFDENGKLLTANDPDEQLRKDMNGKTRAEILKTGHSRYELSKQATGS